MADDCAELLVRLMTWRVNPIQLQEFGRRRCVECVWRVGARGQCCRRSVLARAGMQDVGSSQGFHQWIRLVVLYTMVWLQTRLDNFDFWVWIKHLFFFQEQALIPVVRIFQKSNTHKFTWFGNLPTPRSYWFVLILLRNNTNNKTRRRRKFFSTQLNSLSSSLTVFLSISYTPLSSQ